MNYCILVLVLLIKNKKDLLLLIGETDTFYYKDSFSA